MKKILLLLAVAFTALQMSAADVTSTQAQAAATAFLNKQVAAGHIKASAASNLTLVKAEKSVAKPSAVDYYIFNSAKSYVVVAGDDLAPQILMYGEEGALDMDNIPPGMQWLLNKYKYQIDGLKAGTLVPVKLPKFATTPVAPLVNANWDQSAPYNNQCPSSGGSHAVTGCPATSLAMCYYKWKWPETYPAVAALSGTGGLSAAALPARAADWANIIDEYTGPTNYSSTAEQKEAVAWLMRYAGQAIPDYQYSTSASGANDPEIYQGCLNMGYTDAQYLLLTELVSSGWTYTNGPQQYTDAEWNEYMLNELHNGRPIEYLAYDVSYGYSVSGHAFNVFGCNASGQYYVNWGWSGDSNGYCTLHNFTTATGATGQSGSYVFNYGEAMIIGIEPPGGALTNPRITVNPTSLNMNAIVGNPVTATFTVKGYNLTSNVSLSLSGSNAFSLSTTSISVAQAENEATVTVTYNPSTSGSHEATVTLTSTDAETVTLKINGTAELETYTPVMLEASNITSTSFTATWTDETPAANVESYTLYVSDKPFLPPFALLDSVDWSSSANIPTGWSQNGLTYYSSNSAAYLSSSSSSYVQTGTYDLTGYDKVTVMVYSEPYQSNNTMTVATTAQTKTVNLSGNSFSWYTFVLDCNSSDRVKITTSGMPDMRYVKVYAGDLTAAMQRKASETGDATYRVITGITSKSYTVTGLTEAGTFNFYVVANYIDGNMRESNTEQVTLLENSDPTIVVNPSALDMTANVGETATATFHVSGSNLAGNVTLALNDENGVYSINPSTITAEEALNGVDVTVTYAPTAVGANNATVTLTSAGAENVTVALNGVATLAKYAPVMLPANESYINLTRFRADWTDATPDANVASYTLEVNTKPDEPEPTYVELENVDFSNLTAVLNSSNQYTNQVNYYSDYLPEGWTANAGLFIDDGAIITGQLTQSSSSYVFTVTSKTYDMAGYNKMSVVFNASTFSSTYGTEVTVNVATSAGSQNVTVNSTSFNTFTVVLDCAENDKVTFTGVSGLYCISGITIYAGDINEQPASLMAVETGGPDYRLIEGITPDKFYMVNDLTAGGTFIYRVKAIYVDGTESEWSNVEEVTLFDNGHGFELGDVNHDQTINITDVTMLISAVLGGNTDEICEICADFNEDGIVNITDVTQLLSFVNNQSLKLQRRGYQVKL